MNLATSDGGGLSGIRRGSDRFTVFLPPSRSVKERDDVRKCVQMVKGKTKEEQWPKLKGKCWGGERAPQHLRWPWPSTELLHRAPGSAHNGRLETARRQFAWLRSRPRGQLLATRSQLSSGGVRTRVRPGICLQCGGARTKGQDGAWGTGRPPTPGRQPDGPRGNPGGRGAERRATEPELRHQLLPVLRFAGDPSQKNRKQPTLSGTQSGAQLLGACRSPGAI